MDAHHLLDEAKKCRWLPARLSMITPSMAVPRVPDREGDADGAMALCENRAAYVIVVELAEAGDAEHAADVADAQLPLACIAACRAGGATSMRLPASGLWGWVPRGVYHAAA